MNPLSVHPNVRSPKRHYIKGVKKPFPNGSFHSNSLTSAEPLVINKQGCHPRIGVRSGLCASDNAATGRHDCRLADKDGIINTGLPLCGLCASDNATTGRHDCRLADKEGIINTWPPSRDRNEEWPLCLRQCGH